MAGTNLTVDMNARLVNWHKGIDQANKYLDKLGRNAAQTNAQLNKLAAGSAAVVRGLAGLAGITIGLQAARDVTQFADALANASERVDVNIEDLQALRSEAEKLGMGFNQTDTALQRWSRRVAEARQGTGTLAQVLEQYNIELTNLDGTQRSNIELLDDFRELLGNTADAGERNRIAMAAFDTEGVKLGQTLANLDGSIQDTTAALIKQGRVMSEESVRAAAEMETKFTEITQTISTNFKSMIVDATNGWKAIIKVFSGESMASAVTPTIGINEELKKSSARIADIKTDLQGWRDSLLPAMFTQQRIAILERDLKVATNARAALIKEIVKDRKEEELTAESIQQNNVKITEQTATTVALEKEKLAAQKEQEQALASIQSRIEAIGEKTGADAVALGKELDLGDVYLKMRDVTGLLSAGETDEAQQGIENMAAALEKLSEDASGLDLYSIKQARDQLADLATEAFGPTAENKVGIKTETDLKETITVTLQEVQEFLKENPLQIPAQLGLENALAAAVDQEGFRE